jgi:hypothetical protein
VGVVVSEVKLAAVARASAALMREVVLVAVRTNGRSLNYARSIDQDDREVVLAAVEQDGHALQYAAERYKESWDMALAAVLQEPRALKHAAGPLRRTVRANEGMAGGAKRAPASLKLFATAPTGAEVQVEIIVEPLSAWTEFDKVKAEVAAKTAVAAAEQKLAFGGRPLLDCGPLLACVKMRMRLLDIPDDERLAMQAQFQVDMLAESLRSAAEGKQQKGQAAEEDGRVTRRRTKGCKGCKYDYVHSCNVIMRMSQTDSEAGVDLGGRLSRYRKSGGDRPSVLSPVKLATEARVAGLALLIVRIDSVRADLVTTKGVILRMQKTAPDTACCILSAHRGRVLGVLSVPLQMQQELPAAEALLRLLPPLQPGPPPTLMVECGRCWRPLERGSRAARCKCAALGQRPQSNAGAAPSGVGERLQTCVGWGAVRPCSCPAAQAQLALSCDPDCSTEDQKTDNSPLNMRGRPQVRFVGPTHLGVEGDWVGVELDQNASGDTGDGKHDGKLDGHRYFTPDRCGCAGRPLGTRVKYPCRHGVLLRLRGPVDLD